MVDAGFDFEANQLSVTIPTSAFIERKANSFPAVTAWNAATPEIVQLGQDRRWKASVDVTLALERARNGVASMLALGASPDLLILNPTDAATLDLSTSGTSTPYLFPVRDPGSSPLWGLTVVEREQGSRSALIRRSCSSGVE